MLEVAVPVSSSNYLAGFASIEDLIASMPVESVHIECGKEIAARALAAVRSVFERRRCAFYLESDKGYDRETVTSYLRFFARLAGGSISATTAIDHFDLRVCARMRIDKLSAEQLALLNFARMSLFEPEVIFCQRPLADLGADARRLVLTWMAAETDRGTLFITVDQPLREALLMPGAVWWADEDGRLSPAQSEVHEDDDAPHDAARASANAESGHDDDPFFAGDEVRVCKIAAKSGDTTLLFDPREIDFIESANRMNYASVRGELYATALTMDELEEQLTRYGFFRCHRSFIVNVQKVRAVERYTRNSFNLSLSDVAGSSIPLSKGRAEAMRERFGFR